MEVARKKRIRDILKIKPLEEVNPSRVIAMGGLGKRITNFIIPGLFAGFIYGVLSQIAKLDVNAEIELDPPAPNMMVNQFFEIKCKRKGSQTWCRCIRNLWDRII
jgi:hypothetical protein